MRPSDPCQLLSSRPETHATALPFGSRPAGAYQDFITIEISPRLGGGPSPV